MRKCPMTGCRVECGSDCEWYVYDAHTKERGCIMIILARELVRLAQQRNAG